MAITTWSYDIAPCPLRAQASLGTDKDVLHVRLISRASTEASSQGSNNKYASVISTLPVAFVFGILLLGLVVSAVMAVLRRSPRTGSQETEARKSHEQHTLLEEGPRISSHTGCDCDQTLKLLGFPIHNNSCPGQENLPHSRASSSILVAHDDSPVGTHLRPPPATHNAVAPSIPISGTSRQSNMPPGLEDYLFSQRMLTSSTHTSTKPEGISMPLPALIVSSLRCPLSFDRTVPDDTSSFTYARFQATIRSTRSRTTSEFPREPKIRLPPKLKKRTSASW